MKRKILISINDPARLNCKFGAVDCMLEAKTENRFGVPMCGPCYKKWKALQEPEKDLNDKPEKELNDEFYCGEY